MAWREIATFFSTPPMRLLWSDCSYSYRYLSVASETNLRAIHTYIISYISLSVKCKSLLNKPFCMTLDKYAIKSIWAIGNLRTRKRARCTWNLAVNKNVLSLSAKCKAFCEYFKGRNFREQKLSRVFREFEKIWIRGLRGIKCQKFGFLGIFSKTGH